VWHFYCVILITSKKEKWVGRERKCNRVRRDRVHGEKEREREGGRREREDDVIRMKSKDRRRGRGSGPLRHQEVAHHLHTHTVNQPTCARLHSVIVSFVYIQQP